MVGSADVATLLMDMLGTFRFVPKQPLLFGYLWKLGQCATEQQRPRTEDIHVPIRCGKEKHNSKRGRDNKQDCSPVGYWDTIWSLYWGEEIANVTHMVNIVVHGANKLHTQAMKPYALYGISSILQRRHILTEVKLRRYNWEAPTTDRSRRYQMQLSLMCWW